MSDSEDEHFCYYGTPLEPYEAEDIPKKKPISIEDQIATDAQGRRRFHGAFTGGFSAGFFNTVGSLEGWTPSDFKSTRQEKAQKTTQKPEDFMDDEDIGEFGIASQRVKASSDYSTARKRKRQRFSEGPIPGEPLLHSILNSGNETIGYILLRNIGLRDTKRHDVSFERDQDEQADNQKVYGCEMPKTYEISRHKDTDQYEMPSVYKEFFSKPKTNSFGIGYVGLDNMRSHTFLSQDLIVKERGKKKLTLSGQAFGVGAFEDDDADIYTKEDMSGYDFELTSEKALKQVAKNQAANNVIFDCFVLGKKMVTFKEYPPPKISHSFTGRYKIKKSRFEPLPEETTKRKDMNAETRAKYLENEPSAAQVVDPGHGVSKPQTQKEVVDVSSDSNRETISDFMSALVFNRFVSGSVLEDSHNPSKATESEIEYCTQEMRTAIKMKMFGPLTRTTFDWQPVNHLCKRFNVPEPNVELGRDLKRKRTKHVIFDYQKFDEVSELKPGLSVSHTKTNETTALDKDDLNVDEKATPKDTDNKSSPQEGTTSEEIGTSSESGEKTQSIPISEKLDVAKNMDLYKSIFLSSSESEDEDDKKLDKELDESKIEEDKEPKFDVLSDQLLLKIKPIKEGILSSMDLTVFNMEPKIFQDQQKNEPEKPQHPVDELNTYGPSLPCGVLGKETPVAEFSTKRTHSINDDDDDSDAWVEKSKSGDKRHKKHRKKKHKKHKHKKDKHR